MFGNLSLLLFFFSLLIFVCYHLCISRSTQLLSLKPIICNLRMYLDPKCTQVLSLGATRRANGPCTLSKRHPSQSMLQLRYEMLQLATLVVNVILPSCCSRQGKLLPDETSPQAQRSSMHLCQKAPSPPSLLSPHSILQLRRERRPVHF